MECSQCGSRDIDLNEAAGAATCVSCGHVLEENVIVSSIEFAESNDRSHVIGQFVSATSSKPFNSGTRARGRYGNTRESRDATLAAARRNIQQVASSLRLPPIYVDKAYRLYQLALQRNFIFGRRQMHVVATCLYTICRQEKSPHLLIDFSDALQVNVYILGKSFLQFARILNLTLPIVDPALYIHRFSARLDLGDKMNLVSTTALRIVTRLKKDWINSGRRPDGVCAAAMLIAARSHGFHKSQQEIGKIFRISADTLKKRLSDFKATPSAQLTIDEFHQHDSNVEFDPPSFIRRQIQVNNGAVHLALSYPGSAGAVESISNNNTHSEIINAGSSSGARGRGMRDTTGAGRDDDEGGGEGEGGGYGDSDDDESVFASDDDEGGDDLRRPKMTGLPVSASQQRQQQQQEQQQEQQQQQLLLQRQQKKGTLTSIDGVNIVVPLLGLQPKAHKPQSRVKARNMQAKQDLYNDIYTDVARAAAEAGGAGVGVGDADSDFDGDIATGAGTMTETAIALRKEAQGYEQSLKAAASRGAGGGSSGGGIRSDIIAGMQDAWLENKSHRGSTETTKGGGGSSSSSSGGGADGGKGSGGANSSNASNPKKKSLPVVVTSVLTVADPAAPPPAVTAIAVQRPLTAAASRAFAKEGDEIDEEAQDLLDEEIEGYILNDEEMEKRKAIREQLYGDFMKERARKKQEKASKEGEAGARLAAGGKSRKRRQDGSAKGSAAAGPQKSRKINYEAEANLLLQESLGSDGGFINPSTLLADEQPSLVTTGTVKVRVPIHVPGSAAAAASSSYSRKAAHAARMDDGDEDELTYEDQQSDQEEFE